MGHLLGLFDEPFLGMRPTRQGVMLRYAEFNQVVGDRIVDSTMFLDVMNLMAQVGAEIDQGRLPGGVEDDRTAGPAVVRVVGAANVAVAADHGNPDRGAGAKEGEGGRHGEVQSAEVQRGEVGNGREVRWGVACCGDACILRRGLKSGC